MTDRIRSLLFVPAAEHKLQKISRLEADAFIIDLEDSVKPERKDQALQDVVSYLQREYPEGKRIYIRLNRGRIETEYKTLGIVSDRIEGFMVPKTEGPADLEVLSGSGKKVVALIETAAGMIRIGQIAEDEAVIAIAFGAEDYCSSLCMSNREEYLLPVKSEIVRYAKAFGKACYDTISREITGSKELRESVQISKDLGFDGKLAIHPVQVSVIGEIFGQMDEERMKRIIDAFESSEEGVVVVDGIVYETPHIERMKKELKI